MKFWRKVLFFILKTETFTNINPLLKHFEIGTTFYPYRVSLAVCIDIRIYVLFCIFLL